ncbi:unnamed protein product [Cuscuta campestris]|uniref:GH10 domain-containing protein n=1 Tax=Cuscuta campestris TaxID=132261 RepID=A0A484LFP7_9ASTE|nr:unnamed protein product [Cuscuta campestris]
MRGHIPDGGGDEKKNKSVVILNPEFEEGLSNWTGRGCDIALRDSMDDGKTVSPSGKAFACAANRTQDWNGIQQDISGRAQRKLAYEATATVRVHGTTDVAQTAQVRATLWLQYADLHEQYIGIARAEANAKEWTQLQGKFLIHGSPSKVVIFLEGPPPGTDVLISSFDVKHAPKVPPSPPPLIENPGYGVNIITNSNLNDGTNGWYSLGNSTMTSATGSPRILPPMARDSLGPHSLSGRYILVTNRTQSWMGPAQEITGKVKPFLTYQVSAWVKTGNNAAGPPQVANVAVSVDGQWLNGGQVEITDDDRWHEIGGAFRVEKQPTAKITAYIQGPAPGVDLMVAGLQIFAVDRKARFKDLKIQTDKIRKRDVVLKFSGLGSSGTSVKIRQTHNSFPFGSCISRSEMDNEDLTSFFVKNFNWAVFENELKWYSTEPQRGKLNYKDADELLDFCTKNNLQARGHCIFWEVEAAVQQWIRSLTEADMLAAVQSRLTGLLTRYEGKFPHYDVNNEMLHGSFYQDHLGKDIRANMFKTAHQLDPSVVLFVNDYHVEDCADSRSSPEKYIDQILDLVRQGAPVGGVGIQGHVDSPVGSIVSSALDKMGTLGLPIWFTEVDVSSVNEHVRADDIEVMIRECFAHPAVEGIMLWGFWELNMSRENAYLVNAEGGVNEAGKRLLGLKQEWLTNCHGRVDDKDEQYCFRGFHGSYEMEVITASSKRITKTFVVEKGEDPLVISIDLF